MPDPTSKTTPPRALLLLADGAEEMEVTITADVLRRGGVEVVIAGLAGSDPVTCSRGVRLVPDIGLDAAGEGFDVVVLPGGMGGAEALAASTAVGGILRRQRRAGRTIAAICAAPIALVRHGIDAGERMTAHPSVREEVAGHGIFSAERVVIVTVADQGAGAGRLITSQGPGTAFEFALALVDALRGRQVAAGLRAPMCLPSP